MGAASRRPTTRPAATAWLCASPHRRRGQRQRTGPRDGGLVNSCPGSGRTGQGRAAHRVRRRGPDGEMNLIRAISRARSTAAGRVRAFADAGIAGLHAVEAPLTLTSYDAEKALARRDGAVELMRRRRQRPGRAQPRGGSCADRSHPLPAPGPRRLGGRQVPDLRLTRPGGDGACTRWPAGEVGINWLSKVGTDPYAAARTTWRSTRTTAAHQRRHHHLERRAVAEDLRLLAERGPVGLAHRPAAGLGQAGSPQGHHDLDRPHVRRPECGDQAVLVGCPVLGGERDPAEDAALPAGTGGPPDRHEPCGGRHLARGPEGRPRPPCPSRAYPAPPDCDGGARPGQSPWGRFPPARRKLPDRVYRVANTEADVARAGLDNSGGITGTWTLRVADGTFQLSCRPLESPGTDCGARGLRRSSRGWEAPRGGEPGVLRVSTPTCSQGLADAPCLCPSPARAPASTAGTTGWRGRSTGRP